MDICHVRDIFRFFGSAGTMIGVVAMLATFSLTYGEVSGPTFENKENGTACAFCNNSALCRFATITVNGSTILASYYNCDTLESSSVEICANLEDVIDMNITCSFDDDLNLRRSAIYYSQPTGFTCSLEATVSGPPTTANVQCTWEVPAGRSSPDFFTVRLPSGTEDVLPGTQTSYNFILSCGEGESQEVAIASNNHLDNVTYNFSDGCQQVRSAGIAAQPTNFNCSLQLELEATVCGPPSTATVLCTWEVPSGRSVVFFTLNGTEVDVLVTNYSFVLSCEGEGPQLVAIASNNYLYNETYDLQNLIDKCQQECSSKMSPSKTSSHSAGAISGYVLGSIVIVVVTCILPGTCIIAVVAWRRKHTRKENVSGEESNVIGEMECKGPSILPNGSDTPIHPSTATNDLPMTDLQQPSSPIAGGPPLPEDTPIPPSTVTNDLPMTDHQQPPSPTAGGPPLPKEVGSDEEPGSEVESESGSDDEPGSESGSEPIPSVPNPESERISSKHAHLETTSGPGQTEGLRRRV